MAAYGGRDRFEKILDQDCSVLSGQISDYILILLYPAVAVGALMQLRISPRHWILCLIVQLVALGSQYLLGTRWEQPVFVCNFLPSYLATLTAHIVIVTANRHNLTQLNIGPMAYLFKKFDKAKPPKPKKPRVASFSGNTSVVFASPAPQDRAEALLQRKMHFTKRMLKSRGYAHDSSAANGYVRNLRFQYQRSDLWFCLLPALYLLVPGSSVWRIAFFFIVESTKGNAADSGSSVGELVSGVLVIGQVIGVRLGIATLWVASEIKRSCFESSRAAAATNPPSAILVV
jgi:uncharacterized membrane protein YjjB (DUF3815 family)